ncbi:MAG: ATP-binding protein [Mycobacterium sp.]|nr:ATP-binding protein [Mycobacterium sp.]
MNLTNNDPTAAAAHGDPSGRAPITNVTEWLANLDNDMRPTLRALGELLLGVSAQTSTSRPERADTFTARCLGVANTAQLLEEQRDLNSVSRLTFALALAEWIDKHSHLCQIGPDEYADPPKWSQTQVGEQHYRHPLCLRVHFPDGTLLKDTSCVISLDARMGHLRSPKISAYVTPEHQDDARAVLEQLAERATDLNPYRGRAVRATFAAGLGLTLTVIDLPSTVTRDTVVVGEQVWSELDLGLSAVREHHTLLNTHSLGARRGVLLCGPPGTGKSAVSAVVAREVVGEFTVIYVEAKAGAQLLSAVVHEAQRLGGPVLLVLEDVDLWCHDRKTSGAGLSELLQAMDIAPTARILTLASTNDAATLDKAAIRTGRFDSIVEVGYPTRPDAARILSALVHNLPDAHTVDTTAVAAALPENTSGSDLREIVRRAILTGGHLSTAALLDEVGTGRYRAAAPDGMYL